MATPIKERGIRWVENYGDKSSVLKGRMDKEIGIGSYFRWEGHDNTTDTDYYVVVCPGYSKKKGYFFFAGLRKIPAEHGASGKKFTSMPDALNYAMNTWNVPRPQQRPAKPYNISDIRNKSVVLDAQHDSSAFGNIGKVITSNFHKKAFSIAGSGRITSNFVPFYGDRGYPELLCWAYKASPIMGFLSAFNTRKRFIGADVLDVAERQKVVNEITGEENADAPLAPHLAEGKPPSEEEFYERTENGKEDNALYDVKRDEHKGGIIESYTPFEPMYPEDRPEEGYSLYRWKNVRIYPKVTLPSAILSTANMHATMQRLRAIGAKYQRPAEEYKNLKNKESYKGTLVPGIEVPEQYEPKKNKQFTDLKFSMDPRAYANFQSEMNNLLNTETNGRYKTAKTTIVDDLQKNLVDLMTQKVAGFDWEVPCYEEIGVGSSQLITFDPVTLMPLNMRMGVGGEGTKASQQGEEIEDIKIQDQKRSSEKKEATYEFRNRGDLVSKNSSDISLILGIKHFEALSGNEQSRKEVSDTLLGLDKAFRESSNSPDGGSAIRTYINAKKQEFLTKYPNLSEQLQKWISKEPKDNTSISGPKTKFRQNIKESVQRFEAIDNLILYGERDENNKLIDADESVLLKESRDLREELKPVLQGFKLLSAYKFVGISPKEDVADSRDCADVTSKVLTRSYDVDSTGLPLDAANKLSDKANVSNVEYAPQAIARAKRETLADGSQVFAARVWDANDRKYHYKPLPEGVNPTQDITGVPVVIENPVMCLPDGKGGIREIKKGMVRLKDPNAKNKFVQNGVYETSIGPPERSPRKTHRRRQAGGVVTDVFGAYISEQVVRQARDADGKPFHKRRPLKSESLIKTDPKGARKNQKAYYNFKDPKTGQEDDLSEYFEKMPDGSVVARDTRALMAVVSRILGLTEDEIGPFTGLSDQNIRLIHEKADDGMEYFKAVNAFKTNDQTDPKLFARGQELSQQGIDEEKFNYGRICAGCNKGKTISPDIMNSINEAINNPEAALSPKKTTVFKIKFKDFETGEEGNAQNDYGEDLTYGSERFAQEALTLPYFGEEKTKQFSIFSEVIDSVLIANAEGNITRGKTTLINKIDGYKRGLARHQVETPKKDRFDNEYAPIDPDLALKEMESFKHQKPEEQVQTEEEVSVEQPSPTEQISPVEEPVSPEKEPVPIVQPEAIPVAPQPESPAQVPTAPEPAPIQPQPAGPAVPDPSQYTPTGRKRRVPLAPQPVSSPADHARKIFDTWNKRLSPEILDIKSRAYQHQPEVHQELQRLIHNQQSQAPVASNTLDKLVSLANRYEDEGKYNEADVIDRMIKAIKEKMG